MTNQATINLDQPLKQAKDDFERAYLKHHIAQAGPAPKAMERIEESAQLERSQIYRKLRKLGVKG